MLKTLGYRQSSYTSGLIPKYFTGNYKPIVKYARKYTCFQDSPWNYPGMYQLFEKAYPNSKFILTIRDSKRWLSSWKAWTRRHGGIDRMPYGPLVHKNIYGVEDKIEGNEEKYLEEKYLEFYNTNNLKIIAHFGDRLLIFDFEAGDGWEKLCKFLNKPPINKDIPHLNKRLVTI